MPALIAMGRLNRPSIMVYGGTIAPGHYNARPEYCSLLSALGQKRLPVLLPKKILNLLSVHVPEQVPVAVCANTMAAAIEALGMSLPSFSSNLL